VAQKKSDTWIDGIHFDSSAVKLPTQLVSTQHVRQLGVLVRLQSAVRSITEQEQIVQIQRLHSCLHTQYSQLSITVSLGGWHNGTRHQQVDSQLRHLFAEHLRNDTR